MLKASIPAVIVVAAASFVQAQTPAQAQREINREQRQEKRELNREERTGQAADQRGIQVGEKNDGRHLDGHLANCIALHNQEEIEMAQWAADKTQNAKVKEFAQMLVQDHQQFAQKLQRFETRDASGAAQRTNASATQPAPAAQPNATGTQQNGQRIVQNEVQLPNGRIEYRANYGPNSGGVDEQFYQIEREAVANCERMTKECLGRKQGGDFDKAFVGSQIGAHIATLAHLNAASQHVSGDFQQVLREGAQSVEKHKQRAEELEKELMHGNSQR
jgi:predicted outer membrane protein